MTLGYEFQDYRQQKPPKEGWYVWRLPHRRIEGLTVIFLAKYRLRGAGHQNVLSPSFDYWDGYRVLLPEGPIEWAHYNGLAPKPGRELLEFPGIENASCPFCREVPSWRYHGRFIGASPNDTEYFYLECCKWFNGFGNRMANPIELSNKRNELIS